MAEGVQITTYNSRYFCYHCNREVSVLQSTELACPECSGGFLEEVSQDTYNDHDYEDISDDENELDMLNSLGIANIFRRSVMNVVDTDMESPRNFSDESYDEPDGVDVDDEPEQPEGLHRSLRSILQNLELHMVNSDRFRYLGDYLFQDDIDALSTMLLNETEIVGPPPLPKEQIKLLPTVTVSKEHVDKGVQCTICMEDFHHREKAKGLPCEHFYHETCITPWLERHATCPNCRKVVETQSKNRRSQSCPRSDLSTRSSDQRRYSESSSVNDFFSSSRNPFLFL